MIGIARHLALRELIIPIEGTGRAVSYYRIVRRRAN